VELSDVIDQFHYDYSFADAGAAESAHFAALQEGTDQVDDFNAGGKHLRGSRLVGQRRRLAMDRIVFLRFNRPPLVDRISRHIKHPSHDAFADGHGYRAAAVYDLKAAFETLGARHGYRSDPLVS